jgi:hypothetical protein
MTLRWIDARPEHGRSIFNVAPSISQPAGLRGTSGRVVFRIKIENEHGSTKIGQGHFTAGAVFAADSGCVKNRSGRTDF